MEFIVEDGTIVPGANSLVSVAEATNILWFNVFRFSTWENTTQETKEKYLVMATRYLSLSFTFNGTLVDPTQELPFPRDRLYSADVGGYLPNDIIPKRIKEAVVEIALWYLDRATDSLNVNDNIESIVTEDVEVTFDLNNKIDEIPPIVLRLLTGFATFNGGTIRFIKIRKS